MVVNCSKKMCRHAVLCQAQGENFCLARYNQERHQEYLKRKVKADSEEDVAPSS